MFTHVLSTIVLLIFVSHNAEAQTSTSYWNHNGSVMRVDRAGNELIITYHVPKSGMKTIKPGDRLAHVMLSGKLASGSAWVFKPGCPAAAYAVSGHFADAAQSVLVLSGPAPERQGCQITGYSPKSQHSQLVFTRIHGAQASEPAVEASRFEAPRGCYIKTGTDAAAPDVGVSLSHPTSKTVRIGDAIELRWETALRRNCKTPLYLVLSMPERVRFAGDGFFALAPGAPGPFGVTHDIDKMRVFVPLHIGDVATNGTVSIKPYQASAFTITWALAEVPSWTASPTNKSDFAGDAPLLHQLPTNTATFTVEAGNPQIVIQDRYSLDKPASVVRSKNGRFKLQTFKSFYRVLDAQTRELVLERDGVAPNFSPQSRFVHATLENNTVAEVFDLYSGTLTYAFDSRDTHGDGGQSNAAGVQGIAWGHSDSFMLFSPLSDAHFLNILVDRKPTLVSPYNYKASVSRVVDMHVDLEALTLATMPTSGNPNVSPDPTFYSLLESQEAREENWYIDKKGNSIKEAIPRRFARRYAPFQPTGLTFPEPPIDGNSAGAPVSRSDSRTDCLTAFLTIPKSCADSGKRRRNTTPRSTRSWSVTTRSSLSSGPMPIPMERATGKPSSSEELWRVRARMSC